MHALFNLAGEGTVKGMVTVGIGLVPDPLLGATDLDLVLVQKGTDWMPLQCSLHFTSSLPVSIFCWYCTTTIVRFFLLCFVWFEKSGYGLWTFGIFNFYVMLVLFFLCAINFYLETASVWVDLTKHQLSRDCLLLLLAWPQVCCAVLWFHFAFLHIFVYDWGCWWMDLVTN
jgi:hypothetical protein